MSELLLKILVIFLITKPSMSSYLVIMDISKISFLKKFGPVSLLCWPMCINIILYVIDKLTCDRGLGELLSHLSIFVFIYLVFKISFTKKKIEPHKKILKVDFAWSYLVYHSFSIWTTYHIHYCSEI